MKVYTKVQILEISYSDYRTMRKWCIDQCGPSKWSGAGTRSWYANRDWVHIQRESGLAQVPRSSFRFRNPTHATAFALTWLK